MLDIFRCMYWSMGQVQKTLTPPLGTLFHYDFQMIVENTKNDI